MKTTKPLLAKDIMHRDVIKVSWNMPISELAQLFEEKNITGAPVIDDFGKLIGVVSETDVIRYDASQPHSRENPHSYFQSDLEGEGDDEKDLLSETKEFEDESVLREKTVEDIMTPWTISTQEDAQISEVAKMMVERHVHRVLIVDGKSQLKGIVTTMDIARVVAEE
ncbi:MAG: CBS domain-containing protein [Candidatus Omnitrophica bacterium]|nr:CBS domain-containing protein [Candidatus Omnitrophota bacterium]